MMQKVDRFNFPSSVSKQVDILRSSTDDWEKRRDALIRIQELFNSLELCSSPSNSDSNVVPLETWKSLKVLTKSIQDLRSQIVREACDTIRIIVESTGQLCSKLIKDVVPTLIETRGSGNKTNASYCDDCLRHIIQTVVIPKNTLTHILNTVLESKNKEVRERCLHYLSVMFQTVLKKQSSSKKLKKSNIMEDSHVESMRLVIRKTLEDASMDVRIAARECFVQYNEFNAKEGSFIYYSLDERIQKQINYESQAAVEETLGEKTTQSTPKPSLEKRTRSGSPDSCSEQESSLEKRLSAISIDGITTSTTYSTGQRVMLVSKRIAGTVQFVGETQFSDGLWIGLELDLPSGKNNGVVQGHKYFECGENYGLFVRPDQIMLWKDQVEKGDGCNLTSSESGQNSHSTSQLPVPTNTTSAFDAEDTKPPASATPTPENCSSPVQVLIEETVLRHQNYVNNMLSILHEELKQLNMIENTASAASSIDVISHLENVERSLEEKVNLSKEFLRNVVSLQQRARET